MTYSVTEIAFIRLIGMNTTTEESDLSFDEIEGLNGFGWDALKEIEAKFIDSGFLKAVGRGKNRFLHLTKKGWEMFHNEPKGESDVTPEQKKLQESTTPSRMTSVPRKKKVKLWVKFDDSEPLPWADARAKQFTQAKHIVIEGTVTDSQWKYLQKFESKMTNNTNKQ